MHDALLVGKKITASYFYMAFSGILLQLFFKTPKASCDAEVSSHVGSLLSADQYGLVARFQEVAEKLKEVDGQLDSITGLFREIKDDMDQVIHRLKVKAHEYSVGKLLHTAYTDQQMTRDIANLYKSPFDQEAQRKALEIYTKIVDRIAQDALTIDCEKEKKVAAENGAGAGKSNMPSNLASILASLGCLRFWL